VKHTLYEEEYIALPLIENKMNRLFNVIHVRVFQTIHTIKLSNPPILKL